MIATHIVESRFVETRFGVKIEGQIVETRYVVLRGTLCRNLLPLIYIWACTSIGHIVLCWLSTINCYYLVQEMVVMF